MSKQLIIVTASYAAARLCFDAFRSINNGQRATRFEAHLREVLS